MATTYNTPFMQKPDAGFRLGDIRTMWDAIVNDNASSAAYGIAAAGTTRATATPLTSVLNQVDTTAASTGVNLPLSTGARTTPYQFCIIINNGASTLTVYGAQTGSDTINGTSGATGISQPAGVGTIYVSSKGGAWFTIGAVQNASFGNITATGLTLTGALTGTSATFSSTVTAGDNISVNTVGKGFIQKSIGTNARAGTFTLNGATTVSVSNTTVATSDFIGISLNTPGGTIGALPVVRFVLPGTSFAVLGTASDTSVYNYSIIGAN